MNQWIIGKSTWEIGYWKSFLYEVIYHVPIHFITGRGKSSYYLSFTTWHRGACYVAGNLTSRTERGTARFSRSLPLLISWGTYRTSDDLLLGKMFSCPWRKTALFKYSTFKYVFPEKWVKACETWDKRVFVERCKLHFFSGCCWGTRC